MLFFAIGYLIFLAIITQIYYHSIVNYVLFYFYALFIIKAQLLSTIASSLHKWAKLPRLFSPQDLKYQYLLTSLN